MGSRLDANSKNVRKRIESHTFNDEAGEEYEGSKFGGFVDYMRRKKIKLQNLDTELRSSSTNNTPVFRGVVAHVNGYTQPSLNDLHHLIVTHGGGFLQYLDGKTTVTHVIAASLTPKKKVDFARYRIVKPAWVVDSAKAGKLLPWDNYRVIDEGVAQKVLGFDNGQIISQTNSQRHGYRDQTETSWYTSQLRTDMSEKADVREAIDPSTIEAGLKDGSQVAVERDIPEWDDPPLEAAPIRSVLARFENEGMVKQGLPSPQQDYAKEKEEEGEDASDLLDGDTNLRDHLTLQTGESEAVDAQCLRTSEVEMQQLSVPASKSAEPRQVTAEEHNRILLSDPHMAKSSTANPDFINQYYRESRLHHLSTWKAELKASLQARAQEKSAPQRAKRIPGTRRYVMHVDFDSFFAAVSLRQNPELADKPVVIAHGSGAGSEIASCNYPARKFGVKNGMWMKSALALCPDLKVLPYDFKAYEEASRHFYESILATGGIVQSVSIDEALVDISRHCIEAGGSDGKTQYEGSIFREQTKANEIAQQIRILVKQKTGCEVSIGIGGSILLAKVALRKAKPAGQHQIKPEAILDFIGDLVVTDLPGVAYSLGNKLEEIGVKYVKDIRALTKERLITSLGPKTGEKLYEYSRGIDKSEVGEQVIRKSVSAEINWGIRFVTQDQADEFVQCLCDELSKRLLEQVVKGRHLTMKIMRRAADAPMDPPKNLGHGKCDTFNKSLVLGVPTNDKFVIGKEALSILKGYNFSPGELRGLGVQMTKLEPMASSSLSSSISAAFDSSQRRLQFKKPASLSGGRPQQEVDTFSYGGSENNGPRTTTPRPKSKIRDNPDPIEEAVIPSRAAEYSDPVLGEAKRKLLNISGTQFILPSQIDPAVLAELPADIRARLAPKQKKVAESLPTSPPYTSKANISRSISPLPVPVEHGLPNQSQIDPEIFNALPQDVQKELLAQYDSDATRTKHGHKNQQVLPQSPRRPKPAFSSRKASLTPTKKHKLSTLMSKGKSKTNRASLSTLTQSNFVALQNTKTNTDSDRETSAAGDEISESFLAELPEDIRREIVAEQKRSRLKSKSGLNVGNNKRRTPRVVEAAGNEKFIEGQRRLRLPVLPEKPTFTSRKLSTLAELREAMTAWVEEFPGDNEDGPFEEDAEALTLYLEKVIRIELDMAKAVSVVQWLVFLVENSTTPVKGVCRTWLLILNRLKIGVQDAIRQRGLPPVEFQRF